MLDWSDRHQRMLMRVMSKHSLVYTEMVTTGALIHGDAARYLKFNQGEHPVALQLGGSNPKAMATCAEMAEDAGYDEVNINVGCPSDRVQNGAFGACLMAEPELVAENFAAMQATVDIPVTVKNRIAIDEMEEEDTLRRFLSIVSKEGGCNTFIVHARKAWLSGLSPKQNRDVPPLNYELVYQMKREFPELEIIINGGIKTLDESKQHLAHVDGVMIGREAYHNPYIMMQVDEQLYDDASLDNRSRLEILETYMEYMQSQMSEGVYLKSMSRHLLGLFTGEKGAKAWRRYISENAHKEGAGIEVIEKAASFIEL
ncbi:UNVERIFIED_CONTAM: hypothetical protein GTU68_065391 [Idotea baltica]|nr:hypothetical protein [Idotea baltica]